LNKNYGLDYHANDFSSLSLFLCCRLYLNSKHIKYSFRNALGFIRRTYRREGFLALYRGNTATLARILPYAACQFASFEQFKKLLNVNNSKDPYVRRFIAGSMAGIVSSSITYPLDLARARMAITDKCGYKYDDDGRS
jgi:solute carrier family 25 protein 42